MKMKFLSALAVLLSIPALAVSSFSLPWMNSTGTTTYNSTDHAGAVFVVEAYFLGCHFCNENAHNVDQMASHFASNAKVQVLDVGVDSSDEEYQIWIDHHNPNHPVLNDGGRRLIGQLGTSRYPSTYVINAEGAVVFRSTGVWSQSTFNAIISSVERARFGIKTSQRRVCQFTK